MPNAIEALLQTHLTRYPEARLMDMYRLLHQATFGASYAAVQKKSTQEWLDHEWKLTATAPAETPLLENIGIQGEWVRLHLRPYQAQGGQIKPLLAAILETGKTRQGSAEAMAERWQGFQTWVEAAHKEVFPQWEARLFGVIYAEQKWAVTQHSPVFLRTYRPLYRVLPTAAAQELCQKQHLESRMV